MNGTEKDWERTKKICGSRPDDKTVEELREALGRFIVQQCPKGWTMDQTQIMTLRSLMEHASYYAEGIGE